MSRSAYCCAPAQIPDGVFLVRVQRVRFQGQAQKPYYTLTLAILEPSRFASQVISSRLYCSPKALWKLNWFLRDFGYDTELLDRDEVDEIRLAGLRGVVKISQYLTCPRRYRHRYIDGWKEKDTRAAMLFGRAFETALAAYFRREDPGAV